MADRISVLHPEVSAAEADCGSRLAQACVNLCVDVCREKGFDLAVAVSALAAAGVTIAAKRGLTIEQFVRLLRQLEDDGTGAN